MHLPTLVCINLHSSALICTKLHSSPLTCTYTLWPTFICIYLHLYAFTYIHLHLPTVVCTHLHSSAFPYTRMHSPTFIYIYLHTYAFTYIHLHLGKASKYRHRVTPMPINRVPIFSDSVSIGTDFIGTDWNGIGNGSNFFIGPITDIINSWLISVSVYQRIVIVSHATLLTKIMLGNVSTKAKREWLSFQCTNRLGKTNCLSPYCILSF